MKVHSVIIDQGGNNSRFNVKSSFKDVVISGLSSSKLLRVAIKFDKFKIKSEMYTDHLDFVGDYDMAGQILYLPLKGEGNANISMQQLTSRHEITGDYFTNPDDGETYINVTDYKIRFKPKRVTFKFENLFNGDKVLGNTMNRFMNQNWKVVFEGTASEYEKFFGEKFKSIANNVFQNVPMKKIFLD